MVPKNVCWIQCFLSFSSFYHQFFQDFSKEISPIVDYCKKGTIFAQLHMLRKHLNILNTFFFFLLPLCWCILLIIFYEADILAKPQKQFYWQLWIFKYSLIIFYLSQHTEKQKSFSSLFSFLLYHQIKCKEKGSWYFSCGRHYLTFQFYFFFGKL